MAIFFSASSELKQFLLLGLNLFLKSIKIPWKLFALDLKPVIAGGSTAKVIIFSLIFAQVSNSKQSLENKFSLSKIKR